MLQEIRFAVIGGDQRSAYFARLAEKRGYPVWTAAMEKSEQVDTIHKCSVDAAMIQANFVILPLPLLDRDGMLFAPYSEEKQDVLAILSSIAENTAVYAGRIPAHIREFAKQKGVEIYDYFLREDLQRRNALPTAEGAVEILMQRIPTTVASAKILVLGFGRTAEAVALLLKAMGARVTVCARKEEAVAHAQVLGMKGMRMDRMPKEKLDFEAVVNTVPARVLGGDTIRRLPRDCFLLDLASAPGGMDTKEADRLGMRWEQALSLPGRVAPKTTGGAILDTILKMIAERSAE